MTDAITGVLLGDKGYIQPWLKTELAEQGIRLEPPFRKNMNNAR